jgi:hypothetical protein
LGGGLEAREKMQGKSGARKKRARLEADEMEELG